MKLYIIVKQNSILEKHQVLISRMMEASKITDYEIINILYYDLPVKKNAFYLSFGKEAATQIKLSNHIELPALTALEDLPSNGQSRMLAWQKIQNLVSHMEVFSIFEKNSIPEWDSNQMLKLLELSNTRTGVTIILDNKSVRIKFSDQDKISEQINITFAELLAIKLAIEIFEEKK